MKQLIKCAVVAICLSVLIPNPAFSDSVTLSTDTFDAGVGFGAVTNLLSLQVSSNPNTSGEEEGSIEPIDNEVTVQGIVKETSTTYTSAYLASIGLAAVALV